MKLIFCIATLLTSGRVALAQQMDEWDRGAQVFRERVVVNLPLPYFGGPHPAPHLSGYYAWKVSFGGAPDATLVLRTREPVAGTSNRRIIAATSVWVCPPGTSWVLECTIPAKGSARIGANVLVLEITEPGLVALVRERRPDVLVRQAFYPGGRFFSDHIAIRYR